MTMPINLPEGQPAPVLTGAPLDDAVVSDLTAAGLTCDTGYRDRAERGRDWWPLTIGWQAHGEVPSLPGVVVRPRDVDGVRAAVAIANRHRVPITAQGGRSGVVGGAVPATGGVALDLTQLDAIIDLDTVSGTVTVQAGCLGPVVEAYCRDRGFTIGHFPQSFDLATVGGWLACRGAGQYSNRYGKIEDIVRGVTVVLADGSVVTTGGRGPRSAVGPDLTQLFVGSEGTLGVIVAATLAIWPLPAHEARSAYSFGDVAAGLEACRRMLQRGAHPAVLRLYDATESQRSFGIDRCALIVLDEGDPALVQATMAIVDEECAGAEDEDAELVATWLEHRNNVGQLGPLWERGVVVDTIEVAGPWSQLVRIHDDVTAALRAVEGTMIASVHQSHAYLDGACLYFTFAGRPTDDSTADAYYRQCWDAASTAVLDAGGALSHHHGVGRNRARFVPQALGSAFGVLERIKREFDPNNVLNPGVLGLGGDPW